MQKYFLYKIHIHFPIDIKQLIITTQSLKDQNNLFELIFDIASLDDYLKLGKLSKNIKLTNINLIQYTQGIISIFSKKMFF